jgi:hypothetical protein
VIFIAIDINDPMVVQTLKEFVDTRINKIITQMKKEGELSNEHLHCKIAENGSGSTIKVYIDNSNTPVDVKNPRGFSLTTGQNVAVIFPNGRNDGDRYIDRIL